MAEHKTPTSPLHQAPPPSYERSASPSATAPSTVHEGEIDTGPRIIQPDHTYAYGSQTPQHQQSVSPPPAGGYYSPPPTGAQNMPQYQTSGYVQQQQPEYAQQQQPQQTHLQQAHLQHQSSEHIHGGAATTQQQAGPGRVVGPAGQGQTYKNVTPMYALTSAASPVECPACGARTLTRTQLVTGNTTHAWAAGVCLLTCFGCIPYCVSGTKDVEHKCGNCGVQLATWHRSGRTEVHMHA